MARAAAEVRRRQGRRRWKGGGGKGASVPNAPEHDGQAVGTGERERSAGEVGRDEDWGLVEAVVLRQPAASPESSLSHDPVACGL